jgi:hypothetical protein
MSYIVDAQWNVSLVPLVSDRAHYLPKEHTLLSSDEFKGGTRTYMGRIKTAFVAILCGYNKDIQKVTVLSLNRVFVRKSGSVYVVFGISYRIGSNVTTNFRLICLMFYVILLSSKLKVMVKFKNTSGPKFSKITRCLTVETTSSPFLMFQSHSPQKAIKTDFFPHSPPNQACYTN